MTRRIGVGATNRIDAFFASLRNDRWMADAACTTAHPDAWFPRKGSHDSNAERALYVCLRLCPVRTQCLAYAVAAPEPLQGIWGGTTEQQRRALRQKEARA